jgi:hypothetical protein
MDKKMEGRMVNRMAVSVRCGEVGNDVTTEMAVSVEGMLRSGKGSRWGHGSTVGTGEW